MGAFIARQPNGLLCRFSSIVDTVTDWNMTDEEYIEMKAEQAREEARDTLKHYLHPFKEVISSFRPNNNTQEEFDAIVHNMSENKIQQ